MKNCRMVLLIAGIGLALAFVAWPRADDTLTTGAVAGSASLSPAAISIWETHNLAHLEFLPVEHVEDQSVVFHQPRR